MSKIFMEGNYNNEFIKNKLYGVLKSNNINIDVLKKNNVFLVGG